MEGGVGGGLIFGAEVYCHEHLPFPAHCPPLQVDTLTIELSHLKQGNEQLKTRVRTLTQQTAEAEWALEMSMPVPHGIARHPAPG